MKKVFDVFLFFNELDILELRLKMLDDVVEFFVITECDFTFSGKPKSLIFAKNIDRFKKYIDKITDWKNINELVPENFKKQKSMRRTGNAGIFVASLELVKEGDLSIKQNNLYDDIFIKQK